jgi:ABC-type transport system substrate-binding protein
MKKVVDPVVRMNEFRKGRINLILETSPLDRERVGSIRGVDMNWYLPYSFYQVAINARRGPLADPRSRRALSMMVDRASLVPGVTDRPEGVVMNTGPFPANLFERTVPEYVKGPLPDPAPRDPAAARQLALDGGLAGTRAILLFPDSLGDFGERLARDWPASSRAWALKSSLGAPATRSSAAWSTWRRNSTSP